MCSVLRRHYPKFPTEVECFSILLSSPKDNQLQILSKFALAYPRLKAGGAVLPDLIEFYTWIHEELAYRVDKTYASNNSLEEILTKACKRYGTEDLFTLFNRVKGVFLLAHVVAFYVNLLQMVIISMLKLLEGLLELELVQMFVKERF